MSLRKRSHALSFGSWAFGGFGLVLALGVGLGPKHAHAGRFELVRVLESPAGRTLMAELGVSERAVLAEGVSELAIRRAEDAWQLMRTRAGEARLASFEAVGGLSAVEREALSAFFGAQELVAFRALRFTAPTRLTSPVGEIRKRFLRVGHKMSPRGAGLVFEPKATQTVERLTPVDRLMLRPTLSLVDLEGQVLGARVVNPNTLLEVGGDLSSKGIWVIFTPSAPGSQVRSGHLQIVVQDTIFSRSMDEPFGASMTSSKLTPESAWQIVRDNRFAVAQFFELPAKDVETVGRFFHDRVWFHHARLPEYASNYVALPQTRQADVACGENCVSFLFPWTSPRWTAQRPELVSVARSFGGVRVADIPSEQLFIHAHVPSYRGTFLVTEDPDGLTQLLVGDGWAHEGLRLEQLMLGGPAEFL